ALPTTPRPHSTPRRRVPSSADQGPPQSRLPYIFSSPTPPPPRPTLFPYTTLFRSQRLALVERQRARELVAPRLDQLGDAVHLLRSEEHTSELQSHLNLVCRLPLEKKKQSVSTVSAST